MARLISFAKVVPIYSCATQCTVEQQFSVEHIPPLSHTEIGKSHYRLIFMHCTITGFPFSLSVFSESANKQTPV